MRRPVLICLLAATLAFGVLGNQQTSKAQSNAQLDIVVTDKSGEPITDLKATEFEIEDDGKKVPVTSLAPVKTLGTSAADGRQVIVILDDLGVPANGTVAIQTIADIFMSTAGPGDIVSVLRFSNDTDTVNPDRRVAAQRIGEYKAGIKPLVKDQSPEDMLKLITKLATQLEQPAGRRKAIVCIGSAGLCNIEARPSSAPREMYPNWVNVMTAVSKSHVSVYALIPARMNAIKGGLTDLSGGQLFPANGDFNLASAEIWRDLSQYYMLDYTPTETTKDLRKIAVKVSRKDATARVRGFRGK